jgi:hypothetical protein
VFEFVGRGECTTEGDDTGDDRAAVAAGDDPGEATAVEDAEARMLGRDGG